jgi:eukaryotic translation initiation factor 2C
MMSGPNIASSTTTASTVPANAANSTTASATAAAQGAVAVGVPTANLANMPQPNFIEVQQAAPSPQANNYTIGNAVSVAPSLSGRLLSLTDTLKYPARTELRTRIGQEQNVLSNHFDITIDSNTKFYEYKIMGVPASESRANKRRYMQTTIQAVTFLSNNQNFFATDDIDTIISWINLHQHATGPQVQNGDLATSEGAEWRLIDIADAGAIYALNFQYLRQVDLTGLLDFGNTHHSNPAIYDPSNAENALNIIMKKAINNTNTLHLNDHRFYVRDAFYNLPSPAPSPLRALRGYTYNVKPHMGRLLLNVSSAMSAFWRPLLVSDLFHNGERGLMPFPTGRRALRNLKVYVTYNRGHDAKSQASGINNPQARIKTIRGFGEACDVQQFQFDQRNAQGQITQTTWPTIVQYQQAQYQRTLAHPRLPAVNVGSSLQPSWFAPEDLRILPDQIYAKMIPDQFANHFHRQSCRRPMEIRARIEDEGIRHIPRNAQSQLVQCPAITLNPVMLELPNIRLPYPNIQYRQSAPRTGPLTRVADAYNGRWDLKKARFLSSTSATRQLRWSLLTAPDVDPSAITALTNHFNRQLAITGICPNAQLLGQVMQLADLSETMMGNRINGFLTTQYACVPDIVILLLRQKDQNAYSVFKWLTDKVFLLQSICIVEQSMKPKVLGWDNENALGQYMANVAMKANLKGAGINHSAQGVQQWLTDTLVLGADVTHPGSGALQGSPSIAALVGSMEASGGRFLGNMKLQAAKQEVRS